MELVTHTRLLRNQQWHHASWQDNQASFHTSDLCIKFVNHYAIFILTFYYVYGFTKWYWLLLHGMTDITWLISHITWTKVQEGIAVSAHTRRISSLLSFSTDLLGKIWETQTCKSHHPEKEKATCVVNKENSSEVNVCRHWNTKHSEVIIPKSQMWHFLAVLEKIFEIIHINANVKNVL